MRAYPNRQFLLCGDSGERDVELYADLAGRFGEQVKHIAIRFIENGHHKLSRNQVIQILSTVPKDRWTIFESPSELPDLIAE